MTALDAPGPIPVPAASLLADFFNYGWTIIPELIPKDFCVDVIQAVEQLRLDAPNAMKGGTFDLSGCLLDAYLMLPIVRELACAPRLLKYLEAQFGTKMGPCATENYSKACPSAIVTNSMGYATVPSGYGCVVMVALQDIDAKQHGGLKVYSGSHTWPEFPPNVLCLDRADYDTKIAALIAERQPEQISLSLTSGSGLLLASNLLYAWQPGKDPLAERHTQLTHYLAPWVKVHALDQFTRSSVRLSAAELFTDT